EMLSTDTAQVATTSTEAPPTDGQDVSQLSVKPAPLAHMLFPTEVKIIEVDDSPEQADIARALGLAREDLDETLPIQAVSTGNTMLLVPIRSLADLGNCRPNQNLLDDIFERSEVFRGGTGCYAFSRETMYREMSGSDWLPILPGDRVMARCPDDDVKKPKAEYVLWPPLRDQIFYSD
ncbi:PhzF family phenazine biosynthesis protein, partial [Lacticaseibacillus rhamnosus]